MQLVGAGLHAEGRLVGDRLLDAEHGLTSGGARNSATATRTTAVARAIVAKVRPLQPRVTALERHAAAAKSRVKAGEK
ncbi:MAG: hypothetical protein R2991_14035 [Thermoanaerobaculia bacterium]